MNESRKQKTQKTSIRACVGGCENLKWPNKAICFGIVLSWKISYIYEYDQLLPTYDYLLGQAFQDPSELFQFVRKNLVDKKYYCTLCERFSHQGRNMARNHVESQHFPNTFSYPCDLCGDVLSSRSSHMLHRSKKHLNKKHL